MIIDILNELNVSNSSNYKLDVLKKYKDDDILKKVLKYAYDTIDYTYGVSKSRFDDFNDVGTLDNLNLMFSLLDNLSSRKYTGNAAISETKNILSLLNNNYRNLLLNILNRDLKCNINVKQINKVFKNLIPKPNYMRCDILSDKTSKKISYPALLQLKCDGTYRECHVLNGKATFKTRSGEEYQDDYLSKIMSNLEDGYYIGEFTVGNPLNQTDRTKANGLINSDNPPFENIWFTLWDNLTDDEYNLSSKPRKYLDRIYKLRNVLKELNADIVNVVPTFTVNNLQEALNKTSELMNKGLEGGVLKNLDMGYKNGTSKDQLKIKLKVDVEMRCVGFIKGTKGTKYENLNKVIVFENDEGTIKGQCSGMTDEMVDEVTKNESNYINKILTVKFNDLQKADDHDFYALSHPRFDCWRDDKDTTDTLETVLKLRDMAKGLK